MVANRAPACCFCPPGIKKREEARALQVLIAKDRNAVLVSFSPPLSLSLSLSLSFLGYSCAHACSRTARSRLARQQAQYS